MTSLDVEKKRIKATNVTNTKYTAVDDNLEPAKMHEIAAYNLMVKMHISAKWNVELVSFSKSRGIYTWMLVKRSTQTEGEV